MRTVVVVWVLAMVQCLSVFAERNVMTGTSRQAMQEKDGKEEAQPEPEIDWGKLKDILDFESVKIVRNAKIKIAPGDRRSREVEADVIYFTCSARRSTRRIEIAMYKGEFVNADGKGVGSAPIEIKTRGRDGGDFRRGDVVEGRIVFPANCEDARTVRIVRIGRDRNEGF